MSSSRIIKSDRVKGLPVFSFNFEALEQGALSGGEGEAVDGFVPMQLGQSYPGQSDFSMGQDVCQGQGSREPMAIPEGMQLLAEEDLKAQLDEAYRNGMEEGRRQAERGLANVFRALRDGVASLAEVRESSLRESEDDLLRLSVMVAGKIVRQEIRQDRRILGNIVSAAISGLTEQDGVVVKLNPEDHAEVVNNRSYQLSGMGDDAHVTLKADDSIQPGGCLVETVTGVIDARIEAQLDEIFARLMEERGAHGACAPVQDQEEDHDADAQG